jgi:aminopeptidase YwaD
MDTRAVTIEQLIGDVYLHSEIQETLHFLCDVAGRRWVGTAAEEKAGDYLLAKMGQYGLSNVHAEEFRFPAWQRGSFKMEIVEPFRRCLTAFALPNTGSHKVAAEVIFADFDTHDEWKMLSPAAKNRIVVCEGGPSIGFKHFALSSVDKARMALAAGAVGFVWANSRDGQLPHTGSTDPTIGEQIPCVTISKEDALLLRRTVASEGRAIVQIDTQNTKRLVAARNLVGEIQAKGKNPPIVMATAHYDGHDITDAAHDNAAGCAIMLEAARALSKYPYRLNATLRLVIFTAEEVGVVGSFAYVQEHKQEMNRIRFLLNADGVGYLPSSQYIHVPLGGKLVEYLKEVLDAHHRHVLVEHAVKLNWDHAPFAIQGVHCGSITVLQDECMKSHWGHTAADTVDKLSDDELQSTACSALIILHEVAKAHQWSVQRLKECEVKSAISAGTTELEVAQRLKRWQEMMPSER